MFVSQTLGNRFAAATLALALSVVMFNNTLSVPAAQTAPVAAGQLYVATAFVGEVA